MAIAKTIREKAKEKARLKDVKDYHNAGHIIADTSAKNPNDGDITAIILKE